MKKNWRTQKREPQTLPKHKDWQEAKDLSTPQQNFLKKLTRCQLLSLTPFASGTKKLLLMANQESIALFSKFTSCYWDGGTDRSREGKEEEIWEGADKGSGEEKKKCIWNGLCLSFSNLSVSIWEMLASGKPNEMSVASYFLGCNWVC